MPPPPNCVTSVSVCASPPWFTSRRELPASILTLFSENLHAPANLWSTSCPMKSVNVVPPLPTHVGGFAGTARLKVTGSQSSFIFNVVGSARADTGRSRKTIAAIDAKPDRRKSLVTHPPLSAPVRRCSSEHRKDRPSALSSQALAHVLVICFQLRTHASPASNPRIRRFESTTRQKPKAKTRRSRA